MNIKETKLDNSVVIVTEQNDFYSSACVGVWVGVGSGDENAENNGISHYYEHMVFKGTRTRDAFEQVFSIESRGGYINAYTTKEETCFYAKVMDEDWQIATDVLCDMISEPLFEKREASKERQVVLEEIRGAMDTPDDYVHDLFSMALFDESALKYPIAGTVSSVKKLDDSSLKEHQKNVLNKYQVVVSSSGNISHKDMVKRVQENLKLKKKSTRKKRAKAKIASPKHIVRKRDVQQCNVVVGAVIDDKKFDRNAYNVFNMLFGDGMASRLFQSVREKYGLAYTIYSCIDVHQNGNVFSIVLGAETKKLQKALEVIFHEIQDLLKNGIDEQELDYAKKAIIGNIVLKMESTTARMTAIARPVLENRPRLTLEETIKEINGVTVQDIQRVISYLFDLSKWSSAAIVPKDVSLNLKKYLQSGK